MDLGVLTLELPKPDLRQPETKRIEIKAFSEGLADIGARHAYQVSMSVRRRPARSPSIVRRLGLKAEDVVDHRVHLVSVEAQARHAVVVALQENVERRTRR